MSEMTINTLQFAKVLADETRQKIMDFCCCEWRSVGEIVAALDVSQPTVSHHLAVLRGAGLVATERRGKQVLYTLNQNRMAAACCVLAENFAPEIRLVVVDETPDA